MKDENEKFANPGRVGGSFAMGLGGTYTLGIYDQTNCGTTLGGGWLCRDGNRSTAQWDALLLVDPTALAGTEAGLAVSDGPRDPAVAHSGRRSGHQIDRGRPMSLGRRIIVHMCRRDDAGEQSVHDAGRF